MDWHGNTHGEYVYDMKVNSCVFLLNMQDNILPMLCRLIMQVQFFTYKWLIKIDLRYVKCCHLSKTNSFHSGLRSWWCWSGGFPGTSCWSSRRCTPSRWWGHPRKTWRRSRSRWKNSEAWWSSRRPARPRLASAKGPSPTGR